MIVFPVLIPGQNFLFLGPGRDKMPQEGTKNLRLVFPGITGNGNSRSPLVQTVRELFTHLNDLNGNQMKQKMKGPGILKPEQG